MDYILTEKQIDKILKPYFEKRFENAELVEYDYNENEEQVWEGLIIMKDGKREVLIGRPIEGPLNEWFSNGAYFNGWWDVFNLKPSDFNESMKRFVNKKYNLEIKIII